MSRVFQKGIWSGAALRRVASSAALLSVFAVSAAAQEEEITAADVQTNANVVWTLISAFLVFWMQAGFAFVESGFTRAKNAAHIMMKNILDMSMGAIAYWFVGFGIMFGTSTGLWIGGDHFMLQADNNTTDGQWEYTFWLFQVVFAATAATIVSGAMAERTKFSAYLFYSLGISAIIYPVYGHWAWGNLLIGDNAGAWLADMGFIDFAGSTVVHSVGAWAALAGAIVVGPRLGKYGKDGKPRAIPGHNMSMAALGVFILFLGWFGFNAGSETAADGAIPRIALNTFMAACAGATLAMIVSWFKFGKPDVGMTLNGVLAGLVGITAGCANVGVASALIIGAVAGVLVLFSVLFFDSIKIDDPVGAISVHGVCGVWGTLAAALFNEGGMAPLMPQIVGIAVAFIWVFVTAFILFKVIDSTMGLRVSEEEEREGLDLAEHGYSCYPDFVVTGGTIGAAAATSSTASYSSAPATKSQTADA